MNIFQLIASLSLLVFIHELGHFIMARLFGAKVEKFYLFFNPWFSLAKYRSRRSGTIYGIGWVPLGGYCQISGMVDESLNSEGLKSAPKPDEFRSKKAWQRLLIMAGGVIFNIILALIIYIGIAYTWGDKQLYSSEVRSGWNFSSVAEEVGFVDGDVIYAIDGDTKRNVRSSDFMNQLVEAHEITVLRRLEQGYDTLAIQMPSDVMTRLLRAEERFATMLIPFIIDQVQKEDSPLKPGQEVVAVDAAATSSITDVINLLSEKQGKTISLTVREGDIIRVLEGVKVDDEGRLGVVLRSPEMIFPTSQIKYSLIESIPVGINKATTTISNYVSSLKYIFTKEGAKSMGGLGTMAKLFPETFSWENFWLVSAFLSIILAVMNLLPIPALDGGHIVFILLEMITRRKLSDAVMMRIQTVGVVLLLLLMLYANGNDIYRYLIK